MRQECDRSVPLVETTTPNPSSLDDPTQPHHILRHTKWGMKRALVKRY